MELVLPAAFTLGLLSGFRHAFDPDHVVAVSTLLHHEPKLRRALRLGLAWGAGHTTTLVLAVLLIGLLRIPVTDAWLGYLELPVALMLLVLGGAALYDVHARRAGLRRHAHPGLDPVHADATPHFHVGAYPHPHGFSFGRTGWRGFVVGLVHGLAGSGALLLLAAATLPTPGAGLGYALVFGIGSLAGMALVSLGLALPFLASRSRPGLQHALTGLSGALSIGLAVGILYANVA